MKRKKYKDTIKRCPVCLLLSCKCREEREWEREEMFHHDQAHLPKDPY